MSDIDKTKEQLISKMAEMHQRIAELEASKTEHKRAEEVLKKSEEHLRNVLDSLGPYMLVGLMTPEGTLIEANRPALEIAGLKLEDVLGGPFEETYWWSYSEPVKQQLRDAIRRAARGETCRYDVVVRVGENRFITIDFCLQPMVDEAGRIIYLIPSAVDISERKRVEETLRESEKRYRLLAGNAADTIWTVDMNMRPTYISPSITRLLGYSVKEAMVKRMEEVFTPTSFEVAMKALAEELATEKMEQKDDLFRSRMLELELKRKDGSIVPVEIGYSFLRDADAQPFEILAVARDITERKRMEKELRELYELEKQQRAELEEEQKVRGLFVNILAHELRTPLTPLIASAGLLKDIAAHDPKSREYRLANLVENGAQTLASRLDELLDLARFAVGAFTIHPEPLDLKVLLEKVTPQYERLIEKKKQSIILDVPQTLPVIKADRSRLEQLLSNLLSNATKFSHEEGSITVRARSEGSELVVEVEDHESGLSEEEQERVFKPYHRVEQDRQRFAGLGLGLAVSKQIVEAHGGRIWVKSQLGSGSTFGFSLPLKG